MFSTRSKRDEFYLLIVSVVLFAIMVFTQGCAGVEPYALNAVNAEANVTVDAEGEQPEVAFETLVTLDQAIAGISHLIQIGYTYPDLLRLCFDYSVTACVDLSIAKSWWWLFVDGALVYEGQIGFD